MAVKERIEVVGDVSYRVRYELTESPSWANIDSCGGCGANEPDVMTSVQEVSIFEIRKGHEQIPAGDAVWSVLQDRLNDKCRLVRCERCSG